MPTWPAALPQAFPLGVTVEPMDAVVRSVVSGSPKERRRFTAIPIFYRNIQIIMRQDQVEVLDSFVQNDIGGGADEFDWLDPWVKAGLKTFTFFVAPRWGYLQPDRWSVEFELMELP